MIDQYATSLVKDLEAIAIIAARHGDGFMEDHPAWIAAKEIERLRGALAEIRDAVVEYENLTAKALMRRASMALS
jgi:hypothetical protein